MLTIIAMEKQITLFQARISAQEYPKYRVFSAQQGYN